MDSLDEMESLQDNFLSGNARLENWIKFEIDKVEVDDNFEDSIDYELDLKELELLEEY
jgi:hypothetical protein